MEGLGIAASIIAVVQVTTKVASLTYEYISSAKRAPDNLQKLVGELKSLTGILTALQVNAQDPKSVALQGLEAPLQRYNLEISKLRNKLESKKKGPSPWGATIFRLQWPFREAETLGFTVEVEKFKLSLVLAMNTDQIPRTKVVEENVLEIRESTQKGDIERIDEKLISSLDWLSPGAFDERHIEVSGRRREGTGQWILKASEVQDWRKSPGLLWGYGIPGAGKTFLSSLMIDDLTSQAGYGVAYVYFNYQEQEKQKPTHVLSSLVKQLVCQTQNLPKELEDLRKTQRKPTLQELYTILVGVTKLFTKTFFVFDALDECNQEFQRRELLPLFHRMGCDGMYLFLTSREHPEDIQVSFKNTAKVRLWAKDEDITSYIKQKISENPRAKRLVGEGENRDKIISGLIDCAKGMFLLVHFHIEYLCQQTTIRQILEELEKLKSSSSANANSPLNPTYDRAMGIVQAQPGKCTELAIKILSWLAEARQVLTIRELQLAVSVEKGYTSFDELDLPDIKTMLDVCASLVAIDENSSTVRLVHYTVQEYLLQNPLIYGHARFEVFMACMTFLSSDLFSRGACDSEKALEERIKSYPFLLYASWHIPLHLSVCEEDLSTELVLNFIGRPGNISSYLQALLVSNNNTLAYYDYPKNWTPLHIACRLEHHTITQKLLEDGADILAVEDKGMTALHITASNYMSVSESSNKISITRLLCERGADVSATNNSGKTALHLAASGGLKGVTQMLLERGADISALDNDKKTALCSAVINGKKDLLVYLVEKGANIEAIDNNGKTPLHHAVDVARYGKTYLMACLVEKGANIEATDNDGKTPLHHAASYGGKGSVAYLLEKGADVEATDNDGKTPLHYAASYGGKDSVAYLLEKGADTEATDNDGKTPLHHAATNNKKESVVYLVEKGANIEATDSDGKTPLHHAATIWYGDKYLVVYFVEKCANIEATDNDGKTPLHHAAASYRGKDSVAYLLEKGAKIKATDSDGRTPLHHSASYGEKESVAYLLEKGADIEAIDNYGWSPLYHAAASYRGKDSVAYLLEKGAKIEATDSDGRTPLHHAASYGEKDSVAYLLEKGADIEATDNYGWNPLHYAASYGGKDSVAYLLEKGTDIEATDNDGKTPLHHAATIWYGDKYLVVYFVEKCANIEATDNNRKAPLYHTAASYEGKDSVAYLLEKGADTEAIDNYGWTPLHYAASYGGKDSVAYLLGKGAKIEATDSDGRTPLHHAAASYRGKDSVAYLLEKGADTEATDNYGRTPLHHAASYGEKDSVAYLLEKGAKIEATDNYGRTPLHHAVDVAINVAADEAASAVSVAIVGGYLVEELIAYLLAKGANIEATDNDGKTPLHNAVVAATEWYGMEDLIAYLLEQGANIAATDSDGKTPLHHAVDVAAAAEKFSWGVDLIAYLLEQGSNIEATDKDGKTPLHHAIAIATAAEEYRWGEGLVVYLLEQGANIEATDKDGKTPLHHAAAVYGGKNSVAYLVGKGANISAIDNYGNTASDLANEFGYLEVVQLLRKRSVELLQTYQR